MMEKGAHVSCRGSEYGIGVGVGGASDRNIPACKNGGGNQQLNFELWGHV